MPAAVSVPQVSIPLCVDLDGTLIRSDVLWESLVLLVKRNPLYLLTLPFWLLRGRAYLKQEIATRINLDPANLPYHEGFLKFLHREHAQGRPIILATAADHRLAETVAAHVGIFSGVVASDGQTNMRGASKGAALSKKFGRKGFDYAGNSSVDLGVWRESREAIVVNADDHLTERARGLATVNHVFNDPKSFIGLIARAMRPHQWVKNLIIFVPLMTSHSLGKFDLMKNALLAFAAFSLCASGVYALNDLLDLESDRHHPTKKNRPFASGRLALPAGFFLFPATLILSGAIGALLSRQFIAVLGVYFLVTTSYSLRVKQIVLLDAFFLAGLYTMRLIAGHAATGIEYSFWLLAFSIFLFLSLALVKRYTELNGLRQQNKRDTKGRGYTIGDLELVGMLGVASGFLSVLVMALYVNSNEVQKLYAYPILLLLVCPVLLYWISYVWLRAHRGTMHDDPIVFALKDRTSYLVGALTVIILWLATGHYHLPAIF